MPGNRNTFQANSLRTVSYLHHNHAEQVQQKRRHQEYSALRLDLLPRFLAIHNHDTDKLPVVSGCTGCTGFWPWLAIGEVHILLWKSNQPGHSFRGERVRTGQTAALGGVALLIRRVILENLQGREAQRHRLCHPYTLCSTVVSRIFPSGNIQVLLWCDNALLLNVRQKQKNGAGFPWAKCIGASHPKISYPMASSPSNSPALHAKRPLSAQIRQIQHHNTVTISRSIELHSLLEAIRPRRAHLNPHPSP